MPHLIGVKVRTMDGDHELSIDHWNFEQRKFALVYFVIADSIDDEVEDIETTTDLPVLWDNLFGGYCYRITAREVNVVVSPFGDGRVGLWEVLCEFDQDIMPDQDVAVPHAYYKRAKYRWTSETEQVRFIRDVITQDPIVTANGEPLIFMIDESYPVLEYKRYEQEGEDNERQFSLQKMLNFNNTVNEKEFLGAKIGSVKCNMEGDEHEIIEGELWVPVTYRFKFKFELDPDDTEEFREDAWMAEVPHRGFLYREVAGGEILLHATGDTKYQPTEVNLDEDGVKLSSYQPLEYLRFNRCRKADFDLLEISLNYSPWT